MTLPKAPTWATNANFASPGDPWDTDSTKIEPASAKQAEGWEPTEAPPAEYFNWWMNRAGDLLNRLRDLRFGSWTQSDGTSLDTDLVNIVGNVVRGTIGASTYYVVGTNVLGSSTKRVAVAINPLAQFRVDTIDFSTSETLAGNKSAAFSPVGDGAGGPRFVVALTNSYLIRSDDGTTWNLILASHSNSPWAIIYAATHWVIVGELTGAHTIWTATNGTSYTGRGNPAGQTLRDIVLGGSRLVAVGNAGAVCYSDDDGLTWTNVAAITADNLLQVIWNPAASTFVVISSTGKLWRSTNGITWTLGVDLPTVSTTGARGACDSAGMILIHDHANRAPVAFVTEDSGATYRQVPANGAAHSGIQAVSWDSEWGWILAGATGVVSNDRGRVWVAARTDEIATGD